MQYKFINLLTGRYTLSDILSFYPKKLHNNILKFLKELQSINAISYSYGRVRNFPTPSKNPHLMEVHFELTKKCNLCCQHCYQEKYFQSTQQDLTLPEIANLIVQLENLNVIKASISGGEPLLRKDLEQILSLFKSHGIRVDCIFYQWYFSQR